MEKIVDKNSIIDVCKDISMRLGINTINIRIVAKESNIAIGSVYKYFDSKEELLLATIESIWVEIIDDFLSENNFSNFMDSIYKLFDCFVYGNKKYPNFFKQHAYVMNNHSGNVKGGSIMHEYVASIKNKLLDTLKADKSINFQVFDEDFTMISLVNFVYDHLINIGLISNNKNNDFIFIMIKKLLY